MAQRKRKKLTARQRTAKNKAARTKRATATRPAAPPAGPGETHVRLTIGRCGIGFTQDPGDIIKVSEAEAAKLIAAEKAVPVTQQDVETAMAAGPNEAH